MITVMIEEEGKWRQLREKLKIPKDETFFTFLGENNGLTWFIKENVRYSVKSPKPVYAESIRARVSDS